MINFLQYVYSVFATLSRYTFPSKRHRVWVESGVMMIRIRERIFKNFFHPTTM